MLQGLAAGKLWLEIEAGQARAAQLDKKLKEASKAREQKLRRAPLELRATMAFEMQARSPTSWYRCCEGCCLPITKAFGVQARLPTDACPGVFAGRIAY